MGKKKHRLFTEWFGRRLDLGVWLIGPMFVLIWFLLPARPGPAATHRPKDKALFVRAWGVPMQQLPVHVRPYLVSLPSRYSFAPKQPPAARTAEVPTFRYATSVRTRFAPLSVQDMDWTLRADALLAESKPPLLPERPSEAATSGDRARASEPVAGWDVWLSDGLGETQFVAPADRLSVLSEWEQAWEVKVWVGFVQNGMVQEVFIARSTGVPALDRALVRVLGAADVWKQAEGMGWVVLRHVP